VIGIGDDCAAVALKAGEVSLHTTDCMVEGVHFRRDLRTAREIGWKAVAANLSDIASMGGEPVCFLLSLAIPRGCKEGFIIDLAKGAISCGKRYGAQLSGGNISSSPGPLVVDISMIGKADRRLVVRRSGARPGDLVLVAGSPGRSAAGLFVLESGNTAFLKRHPALVRAHLRPEPMLRLGRMLAKKRLATAMIDTSDGLAQDLGHICESSDVGIELYAGKIPVSSQLKRFCCETGGTALEYGLCGGEDYSLAFTAKPRDLVKIMNIAAVCRARITAIGEATRGSALTVTGAPEGMNLAGHEHLRG
jgi:thiamine-monophosphate kinase